MRPVYRYDIAEREQAAIERKSRQEKTERILRAVALDPDLNMDLLVERFGLVPDTMANLLHRAGYWWEQNAARWVRR